MRDPRNIEFLTAVTIRGEPDALAAFEKDLLPATNEGQRFWPSLVAPVPKELSMIDHDDNEVDPDSLHDLWAGLDQMLLVCLADGRPIPDDCPAAGRASQMVAFCAGPGGDHRSISVDRWLTMCQAAGLDSSSDEATIATAWLRLNPDDRALGAARLRRIRATGYATAAHWCADHWGCVALGQQEDGGIQKTPASEERGPSIDLQLIGLGGAPDLLFQKLARAYPKLRFEMTIISGPGLVWIYEMQGAAVQRRHPQNEAEAQKAMIHLRLATPEDFVAPKEDTVAEPAA